MNSSEAAFYRALAASVVSDIERNGQGIFLDLCEINDEDGRSQFTIRTQDRCRDLVVLNFSGTVPSLYIGGATYPLRVTGSGDAICRESQNLSLEAISKWISAQIAEDLNKQHTKS